jgi:alpha-glucosidase
VLLAREGSAIPVDLAKGGYRPEPFRRGLWLFPAAGDAVFDWRFHEDEGDRIGPRDVWHGTCRTTADTVDVTVAREGPGTFGDAQLTLLLPPGDTRRLAVPDRSSRPVEHQGRRGVSIRLD